jgi:hypothetical protein
MKFPRWAGLLSLPNTVGRTPWSAAGPLAGFFGLPACLILRPKNGSTGTRADQGVCPTSPTQEDLQ